MQVRRITVTLEVRQLPFANFQASPSALVVDKGALEEIARFAITASREAGFEGPIWLRAANLAGGHEWSVNPIPAGEAESELRIDYSGWQAGEPFEIGLEIYDEDPSTIFPDED